MDLRVEGHVGQQLTQSLLVFLVRECSRLFEILEAVPPFPEHLLGVIEALGDVPTERLTEELGEPLPRACVEKFRINADLAVEVRRVSGAVPPARQRPGGQLMEGRGRRVALGVKVPAWWLTQGEQWVEIPLGPGSDVVGRGPSQREIEEHNVQGVATPDHPHGNVVGLDVPMGDALLLEVIHDVKQVHAESLEMLEVEASFLAKTLAKGFDPILVLVDEDWTHKEGGVFADLDRLAEFNNMLVPELLEHLGFVPDASVLLRIARGFEHVVDACASTRRAIEQAP